MTVQRTAYAAGYFVKRKYHFGTNFRDLTDSERQQLQTNHGAYVVTVVDGSPAYESDILPGDIIVRLGGQVANGAGGLTELIKANFGRSVQVGIVRAGASITKHVAILP
jgi:S1-C subfamily serine protease